MKLFWRNTIMANSNSSLNCFANCMAKYEHNYILHTPPCKPVSPHLTFGSMAHEVIYNAGILRDTISDGIGVDYSMIIPSELLYPELKEYFKIKSWEDYFKPVISKCASYEKELCKLITEPYRIERELKLQLTVDQLQELGWNVDDALVGIIDLLIISEHQAVIADYKFSTKVKTQDDFDMNSQLQLYAYLVHNIYNIPYQNIVIAYLDIPKCEYAYPDILSNGKVSRSKSQNVSQENYLAIVNTVHPDDPVYNCEPGGYYYETYMALANNKPAYLNRRYLDNDTFTGIMQDLKNTAELICHMKRYKQPFCKKYDSYTCSNCEYLTACKPWITVDGGNE